MKSKHLIYFCVIVTCLVYLTGCTPLDSTSRVDFYGLFSTRKPEQRVWLFDSTTPFLKEIDLILPIRNRVSPDGEFVAAFVDHDFSELTRVELSRVRTGEQITILTDILWPTLFVGNIDHSLIHWSADGQKLAVLIGGPAWADNFESTTEIVIYDIVARKIELHLTRETWINTFSWSGDSKSFAFLETPKACLGESCNEIKNLSWNLVTYDKGNNTWHENARFTPPSVENDGQWQSSAACNLKWSAGNKYIAVDMPCELHSVTSNEIWILNIQEAVWQKVSNNSYPEFENFRLFWSTDKEAFFLATTVQLYGENIEHKSEFTYYELDNNGRFHKTLEYPQVQVYGYLTISPSEKYLLTTLEDRVQFVSLLSGEVIADFATAQSEFSINGVWTNDGFATKVGEDVVFIHLEENGSVTPIAKAEGLDLVQLFRKK